MYLNQFTNTKKFCTSSELAHDKCLQWIHVRENQKKNKNKTLQIVFLLQK